MLYLRGMVVLATLAVVLCVKSTAGGEYHDPTGFSFVYPEGWFAVADPAKATMRDSMPPEILSWLDKNAADFSKVRMVLVREGHDDFRENLNVVVIDQQLPMNDSTLKALLSQITQNYESMGVKVEDLQGGARKLGTNDTFALEYRSTFPHADFPLRQKQVYLPGGGKTYIVTCSGRADSYADHSQTFENILASFKVPAPAAHGVDWNRVLFAGIIGGVAGGLISLLKKLTGRSNRKAHA